MSEHYTEGRRYSHISKAWILESSWNSQEQIARLETERDTWREKHKELCFQYDDLNAELLSAKQREARLWDGLKVTNEQLEEALKWLGPTGTRAEAQVKACVEYVIAIRKQALEEEAK